MVVDVLVLKVVSKWTSLYPFGLTLINHVTELLEWFALCGLLHDMTIKLPLVIQDLCYVVK